MNSKDLCFLGLVALAYVYLDARMDELTQTPAPRLAARPDVAASITGTALVLRPAMAEVPPGCPRGSAHPIARRADGAIWCRACDEAFFPAMSAEELLAIA